MARGGGAGEREESANARIPLSTTTSLMTKIMNNDDNAAAAVAEADNNDLRMHAACIQSLVGHRLKLTGPIRTRRQ